MKLTPELSALAPIGLWTGGMAAASNATGHDVRSLMLPSLPESMAGAIMFGSHKYGLRSAGLIGYSTLFTGYNPAAGAGRLRALSIGRAALKTGEWTARGLVHYGIGTTALKPWLELGKYGLGGVLGSVSKAEYDKVFEEATGQIRKSRRLAAERYVKRSGANPFGFRLPEVDEAISRLSGVPAERAERLTAARLSRTTSGKIYRALTGWMGGKGFNARGALQTAYEFSETTGKYHPVPLAASGGNVARGTLGRMAGRLVKGGMWLTAASLAVDAAVSVAGSAFESTVRTMQTIRDRTGTLHAMSPGYYTQAAVTERQRAVMELNNSVLNPRNQLMGNEAYYFSGR